MREGSEWRLVREGPAVDGLAESLIEEPDSRSARALLLAEPELVTNELVTALSRRAAQSAQTQMYARRAGRVRAHA